MTELRAQGLAVSFGAIDALRPTDLTLRAGSFVAVTGPSGAGKTTLLWALAGALRATAGSVWWGAEEVTCDDTIRQDFALMPHGHGLATAFTAAENVLIPLLGMSTPPAEARRRAQEALRLVGLEDSGHHLVEELSGGQQQRVALARALARRAAVVLVDEPTSELDAANRARVVAELRAEAARGALVVMTTHDPEAAAETDISLVIHEGLVTGPGR